MNLRHLPNAITGLRLAMAPVLLPAPAPWHQPPWLAAQLGPLQALQETDETQMPADWSWQQVVERLSIQIALSQVQEQKNEPRADAGE